MGPIRLNVGSFVARANDKLIFDLFARARHSAAERGAQFGLARFKSARRKQSLVLSGRPALRPSDARRAPNECAERSGAPHPLLFKPDAANCCR